MWKTPILLLVVILLVNPAAAQQTGRNPRASKFSAKVTQLPNAHNRVERADKQSGATSQSGRTNNPFNPLPSVNPTVPGPSSAGATSALSAGDRPFDASVPANTPFGVSAPSRISPSTSPVAFGSGIDPFSPGQAAVNPFVPASPSPSTPFPVNPQDVSRSQGFSPGQPVSTGQNAPVVRKAPQLKLNPLDGSLHQDTPLNQNPYSLFSIFD